MEWPTLEGRLKHPLTTGLEALLQLEKTVPLTKSANKRLENLVMTELYKYYVEYMAREFGPMQDNPPTLPYDEFVDMMATNPKFIGHKLKKEIENMNTHT